MQQKHLLAGIMATFVLTNAAFAQDVLYQSDDSRPQVSRPYTPAPKKGRAAASRTAAEQGATPAAGPLDAVKIITGDVAGLLNTVFSVRPSKLDDPSAMARE